MGLDFLERIADAYERKARLYPAMISLIPAATFLVVHFGLTLKPWAGVGILSSFGVFYLLAFMARDLGKRLERILYKEWGGIPTTQIQRHRDTRIDSITKRRYHAFLSKQIGVPFPSKEKEKSDPLAADEVYQSAARWLLDRTRDKQKFYLLFEENIAFGFKRNCLGLKPFSIAISAITIISQLVTTNTIDLTQGIVLRSFLEMAFPQKLVLFLSTVMIAIWSFFFTKNSLKRTAFNYAEMLLRTCDVLPNKR